MAIRTSDWRVSATTTVSLFGGAYELPVTVTAFDRRERLPRRWRVDAFPESMRSSQVALLPIDPTPSSISDALTAYLRQELWSVSLGGSEGANVLEALRVPIFGSPPESWEGMKDLIAAAPAGAGAFIVITASDGKPSIAALIVVMLGMSLTVTLVDPILRRTGESLKDWLDRRADAEPPLSRRVPMLRQAPPKKTKKQAKESGPKALPPGNSAGKITKSQPAKDPVARKPRSQTTKKPARTAQGEGPPAKKKARPPES